MEIIHVLLILLIIIFSLLGIYLIFVIKKLSTTIDTLEKDLVELKEKTTPLVEEISDITRSASFITKTVEDQISFISEKVEQIKAKFNFSSEPSNKSPQENAYNLVSNLKAISKGLSTFVREIKK